MVSSMLRLVVSASVLWISPIGVVNATEHPKFEDYPAKIYNGVEAPLKLDTKAAKSFRTLLKRAAREPINFAGRYVFTSWGAGTECAQGAVIDVKTGKTYFLPEAICYWGENRQPFNFRINSRLIILSGKIGEREPDGAHFFEFTGTQFKPIVSKRHGNFFAALFGGGDGGDLPDEIASTDSGLAGTVPIPQSRPRNGDIEPAAGPNDEDVVVLAPNEAARTRFSTLLMSLVRRWGYEEGADEALVNITPALVDTTANLLARSSVKQTVYPDGKRYDLLYNWIADTFFLFEYEGEEVVWIGAASASLISKSAFDVENDSNYFDLILKHRPALFRAVLRDFGLFPNPKRVFSSYLHDDHESRLLKENIVSSMKLLAWGSKDPCRAASKAHLRNVEITFGDDSEPKNSEYYTSASLRIPQGRALAFADKKTNRNMGFLVFEANDTQACNPKATVTSQF